MGIVVTSVVGAGVAGGGVDWAHPAARMRTTERARTSAMVSIFFMPENVDWWVFEDFSIFFETGWLIDDNFPRLTQELPGFLEKTAPLKRT